MSRLEKMKEHYDNIPIPAENALRIQQEIERSRRQQAKMSSTGQAHAATKLIRIIGASAASACIFFTAALNTNQVFAKEAAQLPVIGGLARILTFRSYEMTADDIAVSVEIPTIEMISADTQTDIAAIDQEILALCEQYADDAIMRASGYRTAFLETGGTLEEWAAHDIRITVGYEIKQQSDGYLSFVIRGTESWTTAYSASSYYNLDLRSGKLVTLKDILGDGHIQLANESIMEQIKEREDAGEVFFAPEEGGFTGISDDAKFYMNEKGRPVIVFEKYEIAPGSSGELEFEIP